MKQVIKKPNFRQAVAMLTELLTVRHEGECFVPFHPEEIQAMIDAIKLYSGGK